VFGEGRLAGRVYCEAAVVLAAFWLGFVGEPGSAFLIEFGDLPAFAGTVFFLQGGPHIISLDIGGC